MLKGYHVERVVQRSLVTNKQSSQVAYIHLIPYIPEVQIVYNRSQETTNYYYLRKGEANYYYLRKGEGEGGG